MALRVVAIAAAATAVAAQCDADSSCTYSLTYKGTVRRGRRLRRWCGRAAAALPIAAPPLATAAPLRR